MADKEIIIDGVDVSKCYRYQKKTGYCKGAFKPEELPFCENFDCEFKQLARKTQECEELKKEIINKNEKIKELRFSVSDLTNRLCYLNAEKSFRIVDLEQALNEIEKYFLKQYEIHKSTIGNHAVICNQCEIKKNLDIISKAKDGKNE